MWAGKNREQRLLDPTFQRRFGFVVRGLPKDQAGSCVVPRPDWAKSFPSPCDRFGTETTIKLVLDSGMKHDLHLLVKEWAEEFGSNYVVPLMTTGWGEERRFQYWLIVTDANDHKRMAQHVKKSTAYDAASFAHNMLSHVDEEAWRRQRSHFLDAVMPLTVLQHVVPTIITSTEELISTIRQKELNCTFFYASHMPEPAHNAHELIADTAFTILMRTLFGLPDNFFKPWSKKIRWALQNADRNNARATALLNSWCEAVCEWAEKNPHSCGPVLSRWMETEQVAQSPQGEGTRKVLLDNIAILTLAGHDTTSGTMTFMLMELARNHDVLKTLQQEIDQVWDELRASGRNLTYADLPKLEFMTKCINETLRVWNAVPYGSFRQSMWDEMVSTPTGKAHVPKGTHFVLHNFTTHRNKNLWGADADVWKPDRWEGFADGTDPQFPPVNFSTEEAKCPFSGRNPQSTRFHPFTRAPRDCYGKNFAQLEIRVVMFHLLHEFSVMIAEPTRSYLREDADAIAFSMAGILKPLHGLWVHFVPRNEHAAKL